jgi:hypothetical protein
MQKKKTELGTTHTLEEPRDAVECLTKFTAQVLGVVGALPTGRFVVRLSAVIESVDGLAEQVQPLEG